MTTTALPLPVVFTVPTTISTVVDGGGATVTEIAGSNTEISSTNFNVSGSVTNLAANETKVAAAFVDVNTGETGPGVTQPNGIAGIRISRGASVSAQIVWSESDQSVKIGLAGSLRKVPALATSAAAGFLRWNGMEFTNTGAAYIDNLDQFVSTTSSPEFEDIHIKGSIAVGALGTTHYALPPVDGTAGQVLSTNSDGTTTWVNPVSGGGGGGNGVSIADTSGNTFVTTQATNTDDNTIVMVANGATVQTVTQATTRLHNSLQVAGALTLTPAIVVAPSYTVVLTDSLVIYLGTTPATITLPDNSLFPGRILIFENLTDHVLTIDEHGTDTIEGTSEPLLLDEKYSSLTIMSDGTGNWIIWA